MTEDDVRRIIREELSAAALIDPLSSPTRSELREAEAVLAWIGSLPPGTTGRAGDLLLRFLDGGSSARTCGRPDWTAVSFGMALAHSRGRIVNGRFIERSRMRNGASIFEVTAFPREPMPTSDAPPLPPGRYVYRAP